MGGHRVARQIQFTEDTRLEEAPRTGCSCEGVLLDFITAKDKERITLSCWPACRSIQGVPAGRSDPSRRQGLR